jgi:hypothetical protein
VVRTTPKQYPARNTQWLVQRGRTWYAVKEVPRDLRGKFGKRRRLLKSLETRDYHEAVARRHAVLAEFERVFDQARKGTSNAGSQPRRFMAKTFILECVSITGMPRTGPGDAVETSFQSNHLRHSEQPGRVTDFIA